MQTATNETKKGTQQGANGDPRATREVNLGDRISDAEQALVMASFVELKKRGDGELRVAVKRNQQSGLVEIVYCGVHERADLSSLKTMYDQIRKAGHRF